MKSFKDFINENEEWEQSKNSGSGTHVYTHKTKGDVIHVHSSTVYGKLKNSRLRDASKTKTIISVDHKPGDGKFFSSVINKTIPRTDSPDQDTRDRKAKAAASVIKHVKKHHGVDVSAALKWI